MRRGGILRSLAITLAVLVGLGIIAVVSIYLHVTNKFEAPGPLEAPLQVVLPAGSGAFDIADALYEAGVVSDPNVFATGVWLEGTTGALKAGEYEFGAHVSPAEVMHKLVAGTVVERSLTLAEGLTSVAIVRAVNAAEALLGEVVEVPPEGSLLPETYRYRHGDTRASIIHRMQAAQQEALAALWAGRAADLPLVTPAEAVVLASIVEKETGIAAERAMVAGVFINRLRRGMPLQSDPTVIYAITGGATDLGRALSRADLRMESPFNTYRNKGLPPAPIANPGRASLAAALQPAQTDALYFVADGAGGHAFARTLAEHNRNVARWRALRQERD